MSDKPTEGKRPRLSVSEMRQMLADQHRSGAGEDSPVDFDDQSLDSNGAIGHNKVTGPGHTDAKMNARDVIGAGTKHGSRLNPQNPSTGVEPGELDYQIKTEILEGQRPRETRIRWGLLNVFLILLMLIALVIAAKFTIDQWSGSRSTENTEVVIDSQNLTSKLLECGSPPIVPPVNSSMYARPRQDQSPIQVGPGLDCITLGNIDRNDKVIVMSGAVNVDGQPWVLVREYQESDDMTYPIEGWVPEVDIVPIK